MERELSSILWRSRIIFGYEAILKLGAFMMRDEFAYQDVGLEGFALGLTFYQFESIRFH